MKGASPAAVAAAGGGFTGGGDWGSQLDSTAREVMVKQIMKTLRTHLPVSGREGLSRLKAIADGFEQRFYTEATSKTSYSRKIAMLLLYVENPNPNPHHQATGFPPQGNDPAHSSGVPLMSQQQTREPKTSTSAQDSYLPSPGQSLTGVGEAFTVQNMSEQSTIPQPQLMDTQSAIQSGTPQSQLNIGHQSMQSLCQPYPQYLGGQQRHPHLPMSQQPSLQWTPLTEETSFPMQQQQHELMCQQANLHQIQQNSAVDMQQHKIPVQSFGMNPLHPDNNVVPQFSTENFGNFGFGVFPGLAICHTLASEAGNPRDPLASSYNGVQLGTLENNADREHAMPTGPEMETDKLFSWNENSTFYDELHALITPKSPPLLFSVHGAQYENSEDEVPNFESTADEASNLNKRKFDGISS